MLCGHAGDCGVGERHDSRYDIAELAGKPVVEALLAPPCFPALLADAAVISERPAERYELRLAVTGYLADGRIELGAVDRVMGEGSLYDRELAGCW